MADVLPQIVLVVVLVVINAAFAGTELALVSLREGQLQRLEAKSSTGAVLARLARQPNQFLATIQIGITLAGFLASAAAAVSLAEPLEEPLDFLGNAAGPVSIVAVTLVLSYFTLVFGELAPKRVAMQKAERWGMIMARPLAVMLTITRPAVWLLSHSTDLAVRVLGGDPQQQREEVTEEELRDMVAAHVTFTPEQRSTINGTFEVAERTLDQVLVPRPDVVILDRGCTCEQALSSLAEAGHTRAPVAPDRNLDDVIGMVHIHQLIGQGARPVTEVVNDVPTFPESSYVLTTLRELQQRRVQMALVVNEHGGVDGIVTVEDLVEELVGEIYDETDRDLAGVHHEPDGTIVVRGRFPVHDLVDLRIAAPNGDYATVAGLLLDRLGRLGQTGDTVVIDDVRYEVRAVHGRAITEVAITPPTNQHVTTSGADATTT
jgi:putative hemolysin